MLATALVRAVIVCLARANPVCLLGLVFAIAWPILAPAFSSGISSGSAPHITDIYEVALWGILLGATAGLLAAEKLRSALVSAPAALRSFIVSTTIVAAATAASALVVLTFHIVPTVETPHVYWDTFVPTLALSILHVAAIAITIHGVPVPPSARPMFLIATACALPALVPTAFASIALLRASEPPFQSTIAGDWAALALEFVPILAWLTAALLLHIPSTRRA